MRKIDTLRAPHLMLLLVATLAVAALAAFEAEGDVGAHRASAERALRDYLAVVARGAVEATSGVAVSEIASIIGPVAGARASSPYELLPPLDVLTRVAPPVFVCASAPSYVRLDLRDGTLATAGAPLDARVARWAHDALTIAVASGAGRAPSGAMPTGVALGTGDGAGRALAFGVKRAPFDAPIGVYAIVTCADAFGSSLVARAARQRPEPLAAALADSLLILTVGDVGAPLHRSGAPIAVASVGALTIRAWPGPGATRRLVVRSGSGPRLILLGGLAVVTGTLVLIALAQLGREQELVRLRADFTSSVSHELRTPLAQILLYGETLALGRTRDDASRRAAAETIVREARRLMQMVENVLHVARAERRGNGVRPSAIALGPLAEDIVTGFAPLAASRNASIVVAVPDDLVVLAESGAVRQMLLNLLDNAVRYGPVDQTVRVGGAAHGDDRALLWVDDEGPGVPPRDRERIWAPFVRLARDRVAIAALGTCPGSGLGLAVVRDLAELQGGATRVEDAPQGGARFVVELPRAERGGQTAEREAVHDEDVPSALGPLPSALR